MLPENADPEGVNATFKNGILTLNIKKRAETQKNTIQINAAYSAFNNYLKNI
jgi:HSP20 family molecular chaperone IbpA